ncbi:carbamate kinase [Clostridium nigeriense]|uniref:carbamate kinase n=1 Tax=Clostridium nigeriense TaxID=1805470 RepID=UPI00082FDEB5|nr:carbamate kinase [Clostridium nigeriense]
MKKKIVIALGGNALGNNLEEQMSAVKSTAKAIVDLIEEGHEVVISHGNGPQVGMINLAMDALTKSDSKYSTIPMSVCVAMSQGYVGYDLQNALREELVNRNINKSVATIVTQVEVDKNDKAFENPTKPIGSFMTKEEADALIAKGINVVEDAGRGYRRVVASPKPQSIIEIETIKSLVDSGNVVIACGGGGIPVIKEGNHLRGASAVIDKDFASATLAKELDADFLIILTAVEKAAINYGKENEKWLDNVSVEEMKTYVEEGHFAPGSMKPKVEAGIDFAQSKEGRQALITLLEKAKDGILGKTGTRIIK